MAKRKLKSFEELETFSNVIQRVFQAEDFDHPRKGKWHDYFENNNPIVLELGCGKGEYTVGLARKYPEKNFIGIDIKGARIWRGAKTALEENLQNVAFIRTQVDRIYNFFSPNEVSEIWITFPDPQSQKTRERKRLTSPNFLYRYRRVLKPDGLIHLKTDNHDFFMYTLEIIRENKLELLRHSFDINKDFPNDELLAIETYYESKFRKKGIPIKYLNFKP
ncbi:MAG: tRNA (guanosine(46)-N7)-methyltransferase TrmB [Flavobacteriales bacterium]